MINFQLLAAAFVFSSAAFSAQAATYIPTNTGGITGLSFSIAYTAGVHQGIANDVKGELEIDPVRLEISGGEIRFPIEALNSGNAKRDCHILESVGLDYRQSNYPNEHVCLPNNTMPTSGPNSVVYPEIKFLFRGLNAGNITGVFSMHGVDREIIVPVTVSDAGGGKLRVTSKFSLSLQAFDVTVKKFLFVTVVDELKVDVDLVLAPKIPN